MRLRPDTTPLGNEQHSWTMGRECTDREGCGHGGVQGRQQDDEGYLAVPESGRGPGVLVLHAWWGLTPFFEGVCDRLATAGFVALAPDRDGGPTAATIEEAEALQRRREDSKRTKADLA